MSEQNYYKPTIHPTSRPDTEVSPNNTTSTRQTADQTRPLRTAYDIVVVGAGSGGLTAAVGFAKAGKSVLLVEREHLGGECTNSGCIPSKALLHHAKAYHQARSITGSSELSETYRLQAFSYVREKIAEILAEETPETFERLGITVVWGEAKFTGRSSLQVRETGYTFDTAIIATGSAPRSLDIPGLQPSDLLTNQTFFALPTIPARTLVIGAGPIGLELGQALALLGSRVTLISNSPTIAATEDPAVQAIITKQFEALGIEIIYNATIKGATDHVATCQHTRDDSTVSTTTIPFDSILLAIGRVPVLPTGLEQAGITYTPHGITVNSSYQTSNSRVYALGDVAARLKFTHVADDAARQVVVRVLGRGLLPVNQQKAVPKVTYTLPEMAQVGLSWKEAVDTYGVDRLHRIEVPFTANDRARTDDDTSGLLIVIATRLRGRILGAHLIGPAAGELISIFTLAIDQRISLWSLRRTIFAYPTYALIIKKAGDYFLAAQVASLKKDLRHTIRRSAPITLVITTWCIALVSLYQYQQTFSLTATELALKLFTTITTTAWGPLLYILAYAIRPLTFFPGTALTILSGVFFGFWGGVVYTLIGANLSATLAYFVGRYFSQSMQLERTLLGRYTTRLRSHPFTTTLTLRLIFAPFDLVNYGAGFLRLPFVPYLLATIIGTLLGIATFVSVGASLQVETVLREGVSLAAVDTTFVVTSIGIFIASLAIARLLQRRTTSTEAS